MTNPANKSTANKISDPARILRLFTKISESRLNLFLRTSQESTIVIRGRAGEIGEKSGKKSIAIAEISQKGIMALQDRPTIILEFVLVSSKLVCQCRLVDIGETHILIHLPDRLVGLERRTSSRFKTTQSAMAFARLGIWKPDEDDLLAAPVFNQHHRFMGDICVSDISLGGLCLKTTFPSTARKIRRDSADKQLQLILPMEKQLTIPVHFLWTKKITAPLELKTGLFTTQISWLFGASFDEVSPDQADPIKKFMQKICEQYAL